MIAKNKGLFSKQMMKYMLKSEESDEFSVNSSLEEQNNEDSPTNKKTPGLFIKKLDSQSYKSNSEEKEMKDYVNEYLPDINKPELSQLQMDFLRQNTGSSVTRTLKSLESLNTNSIAIRLNLSQNLTPMQAK